MLRLVAKETDLACDPFVRTEQTARQRVDRDGQDQIEQHGREESREDVVRRSRLAEHVTQHERGDLVEDRDDRDRQHRRVRAVTSGRLAVAPRPITGDRQEERGEAERAEHAGVHQQPRTETGDCAEDRAAQ
jgi:hypothetical protein